MVSYRVPRLRGRHQRRVKGREGKGEGESSGPSLQKTEKHGKAREKTYLWDDS